MAIDATCPNCKTAFQFTDDYAGRLFLCRKCSNTFNIPSNEPQEVAPSILPPPVMLPPADDNEPTPCSNDRMTAGRIGLVLGIWNILGGLCVGALGLLAGTVTVAPQQQQAVSAAAVLLGIMFLGLILAGIVYFVCAASVRQGSSAAAITLIVFAGLQLLWSLFSIGSALLGDSPSAQAAARPSHASQAGYTAGYWFAVILQGVVLILCVKLILSAGAVLNERRPRPRPRRVPALTGA